MQKNSQKPVRLRLPKNTVDKRAKIYWTIQILITLLVMAGVLLVPMVLLPALRPLLVTVLVIVLIIGLVSMLVAPRHKFHFHRWEVTGDAVYASSGWLWREWRVAPLSRIQTVDTEHGPLQQAFGLATVTVTTASAAGPIKIEGLDKVTAAKLAEDLTTLTQATHEDAT